MKNPIKNNLIIELHVPDFGVVKDFYSRLGFKIISEDPVGENPGYLVMQRDDALGKTIINFYGGNGRVYGQEYFKRFPPQTPRGYEVEVTIPVSDIDGFYKRVSGAVSENIVRELAEISDGNVSWKDFSLADPFGFYLRFTELIDWGQE